MVLTLALGIGANTAIFCLIHAVFLKPFPFKDPERIVFASTTFEGERNPGSSAPDYFDYRDRTAGLRTLSAVSWGSSKFTITGGEQPEIVSGFQTTWDMGQTFLIPPAAGRWFSEDEGKAGAALALMISPEYALRKTVGACGRAVPL